MCWAFQFRFIWVSPSQLALLAASSHLQPAIANAIASEIAMSFPIRSAPWPCNLSAT